MDKVWTLDGLITKYITEKTRRGYDASCTSEEIADFLDFISYYVIVNSSHTNYKEALRYYLNSYESKSKKWSTIKEDFVYTPIVKQLESGLVVPTYDLIYELPEYGAFNSEEEAYDDAVNFYLSMYMEYNCPRRKIITEVDLDDETVQFGENAAAALVLQIWNNRKNRYQKDGSWPTQCNDIKKYLLDRDLSSIIELPAMRDELIDFYLTVSKRIMYLSQDDSDFRMSNFEEEILAKSNFDLVMDGYLNSSFYRTVNRNGEGIVLDRKQGEIQTVMDWYTGNIKKNTLNDSKVLTLVKDLKDIKEK